jgi:L-threonylcarbamoyladenylate synthase
MNTEIIIIKNLKKEKNKIKTPAKIISNGGLVAFPTETVYGLGANAFDKKAIKQIFLVKGRPQDNPLIVHISDISQIDQISEKIPENAKKLITKYWPGPLTIVLKKTKIVPDIVTAGFDSVAIRMPKNKIALELIKESKVPIVAPSANISGKPSPTNAKHVKEDLFEKIECIIDGGSCNIGLESTVIDFTSKTPIILRPGYITKENIEKIIGKVELFVSKKNKTPRSPGMKYKHYSPNAFVIMVDYKKNFKKELDKILKKENHKKIGVISFNLDLSYKSKNIIIKNLKSDSKKFAKKLFFYFRFFDQKKVDLIIVQGIKEKKLGLAVMNRLKKATNKFL